MFKAEVQTRRQSWRETKALRQESTARGRPSTPASPTRAKTQEDKTSISEQITVLWKPTASVRGMTITARYQEVGRGWSKKRPEFQRMLADAKQGLFDTIVCWKSDRLSRGMYPAAAALMEVVEAYHIQPGSRHGCHRHEDLWAHGGNRQD